MLALLAVAAAWVSPAEGATALIVTRGDDPVPDGCADGDCSLREAVIAANENPGLDEVRLQAGLYELSLQGSDEYESRTGSLDVKDPLSVVGGGADTTVIDISRLIPADSTEAEPLFLARDTELHLSGVTVRGGRGGVINASQTTLMIAGSVFQENRGRTAVLDVYNATSRPVEVVIEDSVFERNTSDANGRILDFSGPTRKEDAYDIILRRSRFTDNHAFIVVELSGLSQPDGNFCRSCAAEVLIEDSLFERNNARGSVIGNYASPVALVMTGSALRENAGGAIGMSTADVQLESVEIARNTGGLAGGVSLDFSTLVTRGTSFLGNASNVGALRVNNGSSTLIDTLVADNTGLDTAAIEGRATLENTTVSGNRATGPDGVTLRGGFLFSHATVVGNVGDGGVVGPGDDHYYLRSGNSVLAGHVTAAGEPAPNCAAPPPGSTQGYPSAGNLLDDDSCGEQAAAGRVVADVGLGPLAHNGGMTRTHLPLAGSPAIDAADAADAESCPATDQRGVPRPRDGDGDGVAACDVGAVEVVSGFVRRVAASDRVATAVAVSRAAFGDRAAGAVVLARADGFADGLAGAPLAADRDAALLLTHRHVLDPPVEAELARVLPAGGDVYLLGGPEALSAEVEQRVAELGWRPVRVAGGDRYATAVAIAEQLGEPALLLLASGEGFPDALAAGAAAGAAGGALLLTAGDQLPASTADYLARHDTVRRVAVGGPAAAADRGAEPIVGVDRYATAVEVAERLFGQPTAVGVASGVDFPDALAGGADSARRGVPLLLSPPDALPAQVAEYLQDRADQIEDAILYGGARALDLPVEIAVADAIR